MNDIKLPYVNLFITFSSQMDEREIIMHESYPHNAILCAVLHEAKIHDIN